MEEGRRHQTCNSRYCVTDDFMLVNARVICYIECHWESTLESTDECKQARCPFDLFVKQAAMLLELRTPPVSPTAR